MNPVVHFEMPYEDKERAVEFYKKVFGWKAVILGPEMGGYVVVQTSDTDEKGMIKEPGHINGGLYKRTIKADMTGQYPSIVVSVGDIQEAMRKVAEAGGTVIGGGHKAGEPDDIPGIGLYISIFDTEGNRVGMLQPSPRMK